MANNSTKVCIVVNSRANYARIKSVMSAINRSPELELQLIVTGMHLSSEFGLTYNFIEKDLLIKLLKI